MKIIKGFVNSMRLCFVWHADFWSDKICSNDDEANPLLTIFVRTVFYKGELLTQARY